MGGLLPANGLPDDELYVIVDAAVFGDDAHLTRIAYQANVLVLDQEPDFDSLLVAVAGVDVFSNAITLFGAQGWDYRLTLTGPAPGNAGDVVSFNLASSDSNVIDIGLDLLVRDPRRRDQRHVPRALGGQERRDNNDHRNRLVRAQDFEKRADHGDNCQVN